MPERQRGPAGKLTAAARAWAFARRGRTDPAQPTGIDDEIAAQFATMGVAVDRTEGPDDAFQVLRENWDTVMVWLSCETQWRALSSPNGAVIWTGLDYAAVDVVLRRMDLGNDVFRDLQKMERVALGVLGAE